MEILKAINYSNKRAGTGITINNLSGNITFSPAFMERFELENGSRVKFAFDKGTLLISKIDDEDSYTITQYNPSLFKFSARKLVAEIHNRFGHTDNILTVNLLEINPIARNGSIWYALKKTQNYSTKKTSL